MAFFKQFRLLCLKNYYLRKRQKLAFVFELMTPPLLFIILLIIRTRDLTEEFSTCHYPHRAMPTAGLLPFVESTLCAFNQPCLNESATNQSNLGFIQHDNRSLLTSSMRVAMQTANLSAEQKDSVDIFGDALQSILLTLAALPETSVQVNTTIPVASITSNASLLVEALQFCAVGSPYAAQFTNSSFRIHFFRTMTRTIIPLVPELLEGLSIETVIGVLVPALNAQFKHMFCNETLFDENFDAEGADSSKLSSYLCRIKFSPIDCVISLFMFEALPPVNMEGIAQAATLVFADLTGYEISPEDVFNVGQSVVSIQGVLPSLTPIYNQFTTDIWDKWVQALQEAGNTSAPSAGGDDMQAMAPFLNILTCGQYKGFMGELDDRSKTLRQSLRAMPDEEKTEQAKKEKAKPTTCGPERDPIQAEFEGKLCTDNPLYQVLSRFWPPLRGYILVSPDSPATRAVVAKMQLGLDLADSLVQMLDNVAAAAPEYQDALANSAVQDIAVLFNNAINRMNETVGPFDTNTSAVLLGVIDMMGAITAPSSDPQAILPKLAKQLHTVKDVLHCMRLKDRFYFVANETELVETGVCLREWKLYYSGLVFNDSLSGWNESDWLNGTHKDLTVYAIRMSPDIVDGTSSIRDSLGSNRPRNQFLNDLKYLTYGYSFLQDSVERAIIELRTGVKLQLGLYAQQFPTECSTHDQFIPVVVMWMPFLVSVSWLVPFAILVKNIVYEKEQRLKEVMKVMGLGNLVHWCAWFVQAMFTYVICIIVFIALIKIGQIFPATDPSILFMLFFVYGIAATVQCFFLSTLFNKANMATAFAALLYYVSFVPMRVLRRQRDMGYLARTLTCLLPQSALGWGIWEIGNWESEGIGGQWSNAGVAGDQDYTDGFNLYTSIWMMLIDTAIFAWLTFYIEAVFPGQFGISQPFYFFVTPSFWCGNRKRTQEGYEIEPTKSEYSSADYEPCPSTLAVGVNIVNLRKVYDNGCVAVNGMNVRFYESQITSFLGHNGAGKTTTLSILTGLFPSSGGHATVNGFDVHSQIDEIRKSLGFCPQHNVLFENLAVVEQLRFYAGMKGVKAEDSDKEIEKILDDVGLADKRHALAKELSGGMQRKLSIAIAFIGDSRTVILDEPTAGVDPFARRAIWDLLLKYKKGHTIIMSTHHMDEADILGDRIAIVVDGALRCSGTSMFLRNRFGYGYRLTIVRKELEEAQSNGTIMNGHMPNNKLPPLHSPPNDKNEQIGLIKQFVLSSAAGSSFVEALGSEVVFTLPRSDIGLLQSFFALMDTRLVELGINSYGVSDTTLEEIFLKTAATKDEEQLKSEHSDCGCFRKLLRRSSIKNKETPPRALLNQNGSNSAAGSNHSVNGQAKHSEEDAMDATQSASKEGHVPRPVSVPHPRVNKIHNKYKLRLHQLKALLIKRFHNFKRNKKGAVAELAVPVFIVALATYLLQTIPGSPKPNKRPLPIQSSMYTHLDEPAELFFTLNNNASPYGASIFDTLVQEPYAGLACVNNQSELLSDQDCRDAQGLSSDTEWQYPANYNQSASIPYRVDSPDCGCSVLGDYKCPRGAYHPEPRHWLVNSSFKVTDMSQRDVGEYILNTQWMHPTDRYGGYSLSEVNAAAFDSVSLLNIEQSIQVVQSVLTQWLSALNVTGPNTTNPFANVTVTVTDWLGAMDTRHNAIVWFFNKGWASLPAFTTGLNNAILRYALLANNITTSVADSGILGINHPMKWTQTEKDDADTQQDYQTEIFLTAMMILAFSFVPASFVLFLITERVNHSKHLQFINFILPIVLVTCVFFIFNAQTYVNSMNSLCCVWILMLLYGYAVIPCMYIFTFVFNQPPWAFVALGTVNNILGVTSTVAVALLRVLGEQLDDDVLREAKDICEKVFLILPQYCFGGGLFDMALLYVLQSNAAKFGFVIDGDEGDLWSWNKCGGKMVCLFLQGTVFIFLVLLIEHRRAIFKCFRNKLVDNGNADEKEKDADVVNERTKVHHLVNNNKYDDQYGLVLNNVSKVYGGGFTAVDHLCLAVERGQCFGLLGVNGAGKTTTFKMITSKITVTDGEVIINGMSLRDSSQNIYRTVGYCPQFDALNAYLTGREQLAFYARLRGVIEDDVQKVVDWAIEHMHLVSKGNQCTGGYSGGNKRKLSTAIALVGNPMLVLLDEPSTGMDPKTRRFLWDRINDLTRDEHTVLLTTHSMEESEALCTRVGIMVNGRMQCMGSVQHLKQRFGSGYRLQLKLKAQTPKNKRRVSSETDELSRVHSDRVVQVVQQYLPGAVLLETHYMTYDFLLGKEQSSSLSVAFNAVQSIKGLLPVEDYSLHQSSLDDVFIQFASKQREQKIGSSG